MSESLIVVDPATEENEPEEQLESTSANNEPELPEKYRGKSLADVIDMHRNAESELGRRANEVGHYRSLIDDLISVKRQKDLQENPTTEDEVEITPDDLLSDPKSVLDKYIGSHIKKALAPIEEREAKSAAQTEEQKFYSDHPDANELANDAEFHEFIKRTPSRLADARRAANPDGMDVAAARRLVEDFKDFKSLTKPAAANDEQEETPKRRSDSAPTGVEGARKVATEKSGDGSPSGKKVFYQSKVVDLMIKDPEKYRSDAYQKELLAAIKEGRFRK